MVKIHTKPDDKYSHSLIISLAAASVLIMAAVLTGGVFVGRIQAKVRNTSVQVISELTGSKARILHGLLAEAETDMQILAESLELNDGKPFSAAPVENFKTLHKSEFLAVTDADGRYLYGSEKELAQDGIPEDFSAELKTHSTAMSNAVSCETCGRHILFGARIPGGGCGYSAIPISALQNAYGKTTYGDEGYSYIVGRTGDIIIPPIRSGYEQFYSNIKSLLSDSGNDPQELDAFMEALTARRAGAVVFSFDGREQLLCFEPLEIEKDWQLVTVVPLIAVEKDGKQIIAIAACMAVIIVSAIVLALAIGIFSYLNAQKKQRENDLFLRDIYQAISENIDTVIFILDDRSGRLDYVFENSGRLLGIPSREFQKDGSTAEGACLFRDELLSLLRDRRPDNSCEEKIRVYNDRLHREMWLKVLICPFRLRESSKHIFAVTDVTKEHLAQESIRAAVVDAEQANAAKSLFLANMSHDMRTPMNGIVGMTAIAKINLENRERVLDCLNKIDLSSKLLLGLINDVLDMSKIESGKLALASDPFDLSQLFQRLEMIIKPQCESRRQTLTFSIHASHQKLLGDTVRLSQIFMNLLSNAFKFTPEEGEITVTADELEQQHAALASYRFVVTDTGIGISPEFAKTIFAPFSRADDSKVRKTEGTGLGMAITKNLVSSMGGQIFVESGQDKGSSFIVELELPIQEPVQIRISSNEEDVKEDFNYTGKRFLLAEDNMLNREIAVELLCQRGAVVDTAENGKLALEQFLSSAPGYYSAIFMDIQMPVMDGYEAARAIRVSAHLQAGSIAIIAMTANAFADDIKASRDAGMNAHVSKPIDMDAISKTLLQLQI